MSKSKLKPEDIFFGLQKTIAAENADALTSIPEEDIVVVDTIADEEEKPIKEVKTPVKKAVPKKEQPKKKRGPVPDPENQRRVPVHVQVSPETKYSMQLLINEMKLNGLVERYSMTDFVVAAIDEKIKRDKKRFGLE